MNIKLYNETNEKLQSALARLEVVNDILNVETHPDYRRTYLMERGRINKRIATARKALAKMEEKG